MQKLESGRRIYTGPELRNFISSSCELATSSISVFSAFVKLGGVEWLQPHVPSHVRVKLIARWQIGDLAFGASDLEVYEFCTKYDWKFGIDQNLHSKAYVIDHQNVFLGSPNLTSRGLSISIEGNLELGTLIRPTPLDKQRLKQLENACCWLSDGLYEQIRREVSPYLEKADSLAFSGELMEQIAQPVEYLWVSELPHSTPKHILSGDVGERCAPRLGDFCD